MTDGAAVHWLYCPTVTGRMGRVGAAEDEDNDRDYKSEDDDE